MLGLTRDEAGTFIVDGEIDMSNVEELVRAVAAGTDSRGVRLDMSRVTFIDSTGIRGLLRISKLLQERELVLVAPHPRVMLVLRLARLDDTAPFRIVESSEGEGVDDEPGEMT